MDLKRKLASFALMPFMFLAFAKPAVALDPAALANTSFYKENPSMLRRYLEIIGKQPPSEPQVTAAPSAPQPAAATTPQPAAPATLKNSDNLNPVLLQRFMAFRDFIRQKYGTELSIRSGYRSTAEQAYLYRTLPRGQANPPGRSNHERGLAIDYAPYSPQFNRHLAEFGLKLPFGLKEQWHVELA